MLFFSSIKSNSTLDVGPVVYGSSLEFKILTEVWQAIKEILKKGNFNKGTFASISQN